MRSSRPVWRRSAVQSGVPFRMMSMAFESPPCVAALVPFLADNACPTPLAAPSGSNTTVRWPVFSATSESMTVAGASASSSIA
jgi:hypothetical protein